MGCTCSKDVLEASSLTTLASRRKKLKNDKNVDPSQESHPSLTTPSILAATTTSGTSTTTPLKKPPSTTAESPQRQQPASPAVTTIRKGTLPSTPSTLQYDDENDGTWSDDDDEDDQGVDQSDHVESDDEFRRFTEIKDDIQEDLNHLSQLEKEVQQESIQLIKDLDSSHEPVVEGGGSTSLQQQLEPIRVLVTGDDGSYIMKFLRLCYGPPLTEAEQLFYRDCVRANVVQDMRVLCSRLRDDDDFESILMFSEEDDATTTPDIFDTLSAFGQLKHAWQDIRTHGFDGCIAPKYSKSWDGSEGNGGSVEHKLTPRRAFEILVTLLLDDEEDGPILETETPDLFDEEKEETDDTKLFLNLWREIEVLWQSDELKGFLSERPWMLHDSLLFHLSFLEDLARIASPDYVLSPEDLMDISDCTNSSETAVYDINGIKFELSLVSLDIVARPLVNEGELRPHIILFASSLTGFDQTAGTEGVNKMIRSLEVLKSLCCHQDMHNTIATVLLTRQDLFTEKMSYSDIAAIADFDEFTGKANDVGDALSFFVRKFASNLKDSEATTDLVHVFDMSESDLGTILFDASTRVPEARVPLSRATPRDDPSPRHDVFQHATQSVDSATEEGYEVIEV